MSDELEKIKTYVIPKYNDDVMNMIWRVVEEELFIKFDDRRKRNIDCNKPSRFYHFKEALPILIDIKKEESPNSYLTALSTSKSCYKYSIF